MIVDADYLAYRGYYAFFNKDNSEASLKTTTGIESGCFYGFCSLMLRKIRDYSPKQIAICWGDKRNNLIRRQILPSYKADRGETPTEFWKQVNDIKKVFSIMGFNQYLTPGYEADDLIASIAYNCSGDERVKIISADKDLTQLVTDKIFTVALASGFRKRDIEFTPERVKEKFGVPPELIADYLSLIGDKGDNIDGISGIGSKTAAKLLNTYGPIKNWINTMSYLSITNNIKHKLIQGRNTLFINKKLISLKQSKEVPCDKLSTDDELDWGMCINIFNKYEMSRIRPEHLSLNNGNKETNKETNKENIISGF